MTHPSNEGHTGSFLKRAWRALRRRPSSSPLAQSHASSASLPPEYLALLGSPERLAEFERLVRRYFERRDIPFTIHDGYVQISMHGDQMQFGLDNLVASCAQYPVEARDEIGAVVAAHFDAVMRSFDNQSRVAKDLSQFDKARTLLSILLYPAGEINKDLSAYRRERIEGIEEFLAIDLGESIQTLKREDAEPWGQSADKLFELAWANSAAAARPESSFELLDGAARVFEDDSMFGAVHTIAQDGFPEHHGAFGAIVSVPTKHVSMVAAFHGLDVLSILGPMIQITTGLHRDGPKSLSRNIYWVRSGRWIRIPL